MKIRSLNQEIPFFFKNTFPYKSISEKNYQKRTYNIDSNNHQNIEKPKHNKFDYLTYIH